MSVVAHLRMTERIYLYPKGLTNSLISKFLIFGIITVPILVIEFIAIGSLKTAEDRTELLNGNLWLWFILIVFVTSWVSFFMRKKKEQKDKTK